MKGLLLSIFFILLFGGAAGASTDMLSIKSLDIPVQVIGDPSISADGSSIVFVGLDSNNKQQLYTVGADGSNLNKVTSDIVKKWGPVWGDNQIYYISHNSRGLEKVFVIKPDGSDKKELIPGDFRQGKSEEDNPPAWGAPSYAKGFLSYTSFDSKALDKIFLANADGSDSRIVHPDSVRQWNPSLSFDGEKIAFVSHDDMNWEQVFTMKLDGSEKKQLTFDNMRKSNPKWGPGNTISFVSYDNLSDFKERIYIMDEDGGNKKHLLASGSTRQLSPSWSEDGSLFVYADKTLAGSVTLKVVEFKTAKEMPAQEKTTPAATPAPTSDATPMPVITGTVVPTPAVTVILEEPTPAATVAKEEREEVDSRSVLLIVGVLFAVFMVLLAVMYKILG